MKKSISLLFVFVIALSLLTSCFPSAADDTVIRIGVMSGPTGMGMAKLMHDNPEGSEKYEFSIYSAPTNATADLIGGTLDMLCLPTNTAATLKNKNKSRAIKTIKTKTKRRKTASKSRKKTARIPTFIHWTAICTST